MGNIFLDNSTNIINSLNKKIIIKSNNNGAKYLFIQKYIF